MTLYPTDRLALFIDGANLHSATKALNADLDFKRMLEGFREKAVLVRAHYYTAVVEGEEFSAVRPLVDWLGYNGFSVVTKPVKRFIDAQGHSRMKGNMDIEIAVDMLELAPRIESLSASGARGHLLMIADPVEETFPFAGQAVLEDLEGGGRLRVGDAADPDAARALVRAAADLIAVVRDRQAAELVRRRLSGL